MTSVHETPAASWRPQAGSPWSTVQKVLKHLAAPVDAIGPTEEGGGLPFHTILPVAILEGVIAAHRRAVAVRAADDHGAQHPHRNDNVADEEVALKPLDIPKPKPHYPLVRAPRRTAHNSREPAPQIRKN
eukprot:1182510-Prorocentrum_minimum.AAC.8